MRRASLAIIACLAATAPAAADDDADTRAFLAEQLAAQAEVVERAIAVVKQRLSEVDALRTRRMAAIARVIAAPDDGSPGAARRRGAARLLADRDLAERKLLVAELAELSAARQRIAGDAARVPSLALPPSTLAMPARGTIERRFGTFEHERSEATLSRRGVDIEVESGRAHVSTPADGVVKYAGELRGLDQGVIVDHGTFTTVIGKLGEITVPVGAKLAKGDRIGRTARHRVYLELRVKLGPGGMPIDPEPRLDR